MGSEQSQPSTDVRIDAKCVETTDYWTLFNGELPNGNGSSRLVSLFQGEPVVKGQLWTSQSPLDRAAKNLMVYRHPSILKFISSSVRGSKKVLVTERCNPLSMVLSTQSDVQICLGLRNILCSLVFLIEQGGARHLNVCLPSVYVTTSGAWRLAGFEHIWKSSEVNANLLEISQPFRSKSTTDSDEIRNAGVNLEQYSFAKMCEDILKNQPGSDDPMPYLSEFMEYCSTHLRHKVPQKRPRLSAVLQHPYFNHEFIIIHSFLNELPLKNASEKLDFFTSLIDRLRVFDEFNVAVQLGDLLLSRMVLLDPTAQLHVIPHLLSTRTDSNPQSLFSPDVFIRFIVPRILQLFGVLDAQTRLILLEYFGFFVKFISNADLKDVLLPQLLLGIKDKNDVLVAATLRSLAELVPILGAGVVIGRNRSHVFADGRPQANRDAVNPTATDWMDQQQRSITPVLISNKLLSVSSALLDHVDVSESFASNSMRSHVMPERLSPDGGEDEKTTSDVPDLENDAWSDWEPDHDTTELNVVDSTEVTDLATHLTPEASVINSTPIIVTKTMPPEKPVVEIDFFADMEPVIQKTCTQSIAEPKSTQNQSRLLIQSQSGDALADVSFGGWDDDVDEWGDDG